MKSEWRQLSRQTLTYAAGASSGKLIALITVPLYAHYLTPAEYGLIGIAVATSAGARVVGVVGGSGALGIRYFAAGTSAGRRAALQTAARMNLVSGLLAMVVVMAILLLWTSAAPDQLEGTALFLGLIAMSVAVGIASEPLMLGLQLEQRAQQYVAVNLVAGIVGGLVGAVLLVLGARLTSWAVAQLIAAILTFGLSRSYSKALLSNARFSKTECVAVLRTWYPLLPGAALIAAVPVLTPYILWRTGGAEAAGLFAIANQFAAIVALLTGALGTAWLPYFQSQVDAQVEWTPKYRWLLHVHVFAGVALCVAVLVLADEALRWLAAPGFAGAGTVIYPLVVANVLTSLWSFLLPGTYFAGHTATVSWTQLVGAITSAAVLAAHGAGLDAEAAARALALGAAAVVATQLLINQTRAYTVHRFGHGWVVAVTVALCASMYLL